MSDRRVPMLGRRARRRLLEGALSLVDPGRSASKLIVGLPDRRQAAKHRGGLAVAAIFKDEAQHLAEWLVFHRLAGVEHVFLYDNGSTDGSAEVLRPFVASGFVTVHDWPLPWRIAGNLDAQLLAYAHAVHQYGTLWRWMTFIDIDEFLFTPPLPDGTIVPLMDVLADYDDLPVMTVHMTMFGSNGHARRPSGLVIENYPAHAPFPVMSMPKVLCDPTAVRGIGSVHYFVTDLGTGVAFDERRRLVHAKDGRRGARRTAPVSERLRLHHYYIRSQEDWDRKIEARRANYPTRKFERLVEHGRALEAVSSEVCPLIVPFIEPVARDLQAVGRTLGGAMTV